AFAQEVARDPRRARRPVPVADGDLVVLPRAADVRAARGADGAHHLGLFLLVSSAPSPLWGEGRGEGAASVLGRFGNRKLESVSLPPHPTLSPQGRGKSSRIAASDVPGQMD